MTNQPQKTVLINSNSTKTTYRLNQLLEANKILKSKLAISSKSEDELRAKSYIYSTIVEKGNDGIVIIQDGVLKFVNPTISKITGFKKEEAIGKPFMNFVSPKYAKFVMARYKKRLRGETVPNKYEIELISKSMEIIPVEINASLVHHEGRLADLAIIRDITKRKKSEAILTEEKNKLTAIYKSTKEGLALYDKEGRVLYMNPALKNLFGVKKNIMGVKREEIARNRRKYFRYRWLDLIWVFCLSVTDLYQLFYQYFPDQQFY